MQCILAAVTCILAAEGNVTTLAVAGITGILTFQRTDQQATWPQTQTDKQNGNQKDKPGDLVCTKRRK